MNLRESVRAHPWRWLAIAVIALCATALIAAALFVRSLLQPQRFTTLLQSQLAGAGLVLSVDKPASPALWPHPAVQLQGFRLTRAGATSPLLTASEARIVVGWRALLHRNLAIDRLEIQSPRIDLDQLQQLLANLPGSEGPPQLPRIGAGLRVANGTLVHDDDPVLFGLEAETGALLPGVPFRLTASARDDMDRTGSLVLSALPRDQDGALQFDRISLDASVQHGLRLDLAGGAVWRGGSDLAATLTGKLQLPAPSPAPVSTNADKKAASAIATKSTGSDAPFREYTIALAVVPAQSSPPLRVALKLDGNDRHVNARASPDALLAWWRGVLAAPSGKPLALPPIQGEARMDEIGYGPLHMRGVSVEAGADVAPLPEDGAPEPASTAAIPKSGAAH